MAPRSSKASSRRVRVLRRWRIVRRTSASSSLASSVTAPVSSRARVNVACSAGKRGSASGNPASRGYGSACCRRKARAAWATASTVRISTSAAPSSTDPSRAAMRSDSRVSANSPSGKSPCSSMSRRHCQVVSRAAATAGRSRLGVKVWQARLPPGDRAKSASRLRTWSNSRATRSRGRTLLAPRPQAHRGVGERGHPGRVVAHRHWRRGCEVAGRDLAARVPQDQARFVHGDRSPEETEGAAYRRAARWPTPQTPRRSAGVRRPRHTGGRRSRASSWAALWDRRP